MQRASAQPSDHVEAAFRSLERVSRELDASYRSLETRVARLNEELAASRSARMRELAEKERLLERLSSLMAVLPGGVLLVDEAGIVRDINPQARVIYGDPLVGEPWAEVAERTPLPAPDRRERRVSVASRHLDSTGEQVVLVTDTTELHALQSQLGREQRLRALGEMAARMTHEIRTPLASVTLYLSQLRHPDAPASRRAEVCDKLTQRLAQMENLIDSVLGFVRGDDIPAVPVCLQDVLRQFEEIMQPRLASSAVTLSMTPLDRSLVVRGVLDDLVAVLCNLVGNALDAASGQPLVVDVRVAAISPDWVEVRVSDDGPGIDPAIVERLFDPFFTTRARGVGLGLAVVDRVVTATGGEVHAVPGRTRGAEFVITLPLLNYDGES
tara:strand:+ start:324368 stop:325519 length:1152 start_codon:yes stop_codon:yes gene_type:complete